MVVYQQFALVALAKRKLGNAFVWESVVVIVYANMFCVHNVNVGEMAFYCQTFINAPIISTAMVITIIEITTSMSFLAYPVDVYWLDT